MKYIFVYILGNIITKTKYCLCLIQNITYYESHVAYYLFYFKYHHLNQLLITPFFRQEIWNPSGLDKLSKVLLLGSDKQNANLHFSEIRIMPFSCVSSLDGSHAQSQLGCEQRQPGPQGLASRHPLSALLCTKPDSAGPSQCQPFTAWRVVVALWTYF